MAEEKKPREPKKEGGEKKPKRLHLHSIRTEQAEDGSLVHYHTHKPHKNSPHVMPERGPVATSQTPEEAGQHVTEQFGMNQGAQAQEGPAEGAEAQPEGEEQLA